MIFVTSSSLAVPLCLVSRIEQMIFKFRNFMEVPYLPVYKSTRCISRPPKIRRKFTILCFLFYFIYDSVYKSRSIFLGRFLIEKGRLIHRQIR